MGGNAGRVHGTVAAGFEAVRAEFAAVAAEEGGAGRQLHVRWHGRAVVDLWSGEGVRGDSLFALFSAAKGAAHLVAALLVADGTLELDRTVASYWPEFGAEGKDRLTLRELLAHRSGVIGAEGGLSSAELADDRVLAARLAGQKPYWEPGTRYGYHALVIGALTGEVIRRATGRSLQELYEERVRRPYGLDFHLGLPETEEPRFLPAEAAETAGGPGGTRGPSAPGGRSGPGGPAGPGGPSAPGGPAGPGARGPASGPPALTAVAFNLHAGGWSPRELLSFANSRRVRALGPASTGAVGNARGLAGLYAAALGGDGERPPLLDRATREEFTRTPWTGTDAVTGMADSFLLGFEAKGSRYPALGKDAFGHAGAVGADGFADPGTGLAYGYTRRRFSSAGPGAAPENHRLVDAVVRAADEAVRD
ncbi:serine hydrolase domain-containing protein [Streptomyces physcomitrii]|uniref:serine hydrolase domain-containing protein n=1 Tax=Streptomyces physcomitrii TaxID=2724184 RepID=UPI003401CB77